MLFLYDKETGDKPSLLGNRASECTLHLKCKCNVRSFGFQFGTESCKLDNNVLLVALKK